MSNLVARLNSEYDSALKALPIGRLVVQVSEISCVRTGTELEAMDSLRVVVPHVGRRQLPAR